MVLTERVDRREIFETVPVYGQFVANRESEVAVRVAGVVTEVAIEAGDAVAEGDMLAELDHELLEILLAQAEAAIAEARAGVEVARAGILLAERGFARVEGLRGSNAFSQGQFEDREGELARARGEMARAEARLLNAEAERAGASYNLERATIRAPFPATVMDVRIAVGEYVQIGEPVARLLDVAEMEVEANVPAQFVAALAPGQSVQGRGADGGEIALVVRAVLPSEFSATRTRPVRLTPAAGAAPEAALGQTIVIDVPTAPPETLLLAPKDAMIQARGAWTAFVNEDGVAAPRDVVIGRAFADRFEVISGLAEGDEVVVRGNERLRPMQPIAAQPADARPEGSAEVAPARSGG